MSTWIELDKELPLRLRKEVIYEGEDFVKGVWLSKSEVMDGVRFDVLPSRLEELARQVTAFVGEGMEIPLTRGHAGWSQKENHLGKVVGARVLDNESKKSALYLDFEFDSESTRDEAIALDVSIGLEDSPINAGGKVYMKPLRHVAATPIPVIDKLESWSQPEDNMDLTPILAELQLDNEGLLLDSVKGLKSELAALQAKVANLPKIELSNEPSPVLVKGHSDLRKQKLELSVSGHKMAPAVATQLAELFVTDARVGLELSQNDLETFNKVVAIVEEAVANPPLAPTGRKAVELSHDAQEDATAKFLAERAKAKAEHDAKYKN